MAGYSGNSIVDYLKSTGQNASFGSRQTLAQKYGINNYTGTTSQNTTLLGKLRAGGTSTPTTQTPAVSAASAPVNAAQTKYNQAQSAWQQQQQTLNNNWANLQKQTQQQNQQLNNNYQNSTERQEYQRWSNATIDDIAQKYGFDYSREYAARQAEAEAQARRNATEAAKRENSTLNQETMGLIDSNIRNSSQALDHDYFQQFLNQQQNLANSGLNAGLAQDANLRLGMNAQAQLADVYRDANLARTQESNRFNNESTRLAEAMGLIEQQRLAQEDRLFQDLRQQGYQNLMTEKNWWQGVDSEAWQRMQQEVARNLERERAGRSDYEFDLGFGRQTERDAYGELQTYIDRARQEAEFERQMKLREDEFAWQKQMDQAKLSAARSGGGSSSGRRASTSVAPARKDKSLGKLLEDYRNSGSSSALPILQKRSVVSSRVPLVSGTGSGTQTGGGGGRRWIAQY